MSASHKETLLMGKPAILNVTRPTLVLEAGRANTHYWADLFLYRDLFFILAKRDLTVRYKQTVIGILWAVLRPVLTMLVFTLVFGRIAKLPSDGIPYPLLVFTGMLPWFFFSSSVSESSNSLIANANLLTKVYFPRILIPASAVLVATVDFLISMVLLLGLMFYFGFTPGWHMLALPVFMLMAFSSALGIGLWFSTLNIRFRDFQFIVPFVLQFGLYVSPVGFTSSIIPERWQLIYSLNPMVGIIDGFRWATLVRTQFDWQSFGISAALSICLLWSGIHFFRRFERGIADII